MPKTSSIRLVVSIQYRLVTDGRTDGHTTTSYTALAQHRAVKTRFQNNFASSVQCSSLDVYKVSHGLLLSVVQLNGWPVNRIRGEMHTATSTRFSQVIMPFDAIKSFYHASYTSGVSVEYAISVIAGVQSKWLNV